MQPRGGGPQRAPAERSRADGGYPLSARLGDKRKQCETNTQFTGHYCIGHTAGPALLDSPVASGAAPRTQGAPADLCEAPTVGHRAIVTASAGTALLLAWSCADIEQRIADEVEDPQLYEPEPVRDGAVPSWTYDPGACAEADSVPGLQVIVETASGRACDAMVTATADEGSETLERVNDYDGSAQCAHAGLAGKPGEYLLHVSVPGCEAVSRRVEARATSCRQHPTGTVVRVQLPTCRVSEAGTDPSTDGAADASPPSDGGDPG